VETGERYAAFWSYSRFDDSNDREWLTKLKGALEAESRACSGKVIEIFQDVSGTQWGEQWGDKLRGSSDQALFLIPIITPNYFKSEACRSELERFLSAKTRRAFMSLSCRCMLSRAEEHRQADDGKLGSRSQNGPAKRRRERNKYGSRRALFSNRRRASAILAPFRRSLSPKSSTAMEAKNCGASRPDANHFDPSSATPKLLTCPSSTVICCE